MAHCSWRQVLLLLTLAVVLLTSEAARARKRVISPIKLYENVDYTDLLYITRIRSDKGKELKVEYSLTGTGADKYPYNRFIVHPEIGFVRVTVVLDREETPSYDLTALTRFMNGSVAEKTPLRVIVMDQNDNPPTLELHTGNITRTSPKGTLVMTVQGKDDDQAGTIHTELHYSLLGQEPETDPHMFTLNAKTGELHVRESDALDRETHDLYRLLVEVRDMGGAAGALTGTGTVEVTILDDNPPESDETAR